MARAGALFREENLHGGDGDERNHLCGYRRDENALDNLIVGHWNLH